MSKGEGDASPTLSEIRRLRQEEHLDAVLGRAGQSNDPAVVAEALEHLHRYGTEWFGPERMRAIVSFLFPEPENPRVRAISEAVSEWPKAEALWALSVATLWMHGDVFMMKFARALRDDSERSRTGNTTRDQSEFLAFKRLAEAMNVFATPALTFFLAISAEGDITLRKGAVFYLTGR